MADGQIRKLSSLEMIQKRSGMFIGATETPTHLWVECIDNARDEALSGYCNRIDIATENTPMGTWYITRDWGRGIPIRSSEIEEDVPIAIATSLFSGGKFDGTLYDFSSGLHGVGITAVNGLSTMMMITTKNPENNCHRTYVFKNGEFVSKKDIIINDDFSTEIRFLPSKKFFESVICKEDVIIDSLRIARYGLGDNIIINYNNQPIQNTLLTDFIDGCKSSIESEFTNKNNETCKITIALYDDFDSGREYSGIINLLRVNEGNHINLCKNLIVNKLFEIAQKNKKHVQEKDLLVPIKIMCNMKIKNISFGQQTKQVLTTSKNDLLPLIEPVIDSIIKKNSDFVNEIIDKAEEYRINIQASKQFKKSKASGKIVKVEGLKECSVRDITKNSLFIVEGLSAGTTFTRCRDPKYHAILALRGKLLNVVANKATNGKILENQVIKNIASALGYKIFGEVDPKKCRYGSICLVSDADFDGKHIACLLINVFYKLFPALIKAGMVYIVQTPLYGTRDKKTKKFIPIFTEEERQKYGEEYTVSRFKGLGEMDPDELYESAINPITRQCLQLAYEDFNIKNLWENDLGNLVTKEYTGVAKQ